MEQEEKPRKRGGARPGAGRKPSVDGGKNHRILIRISEKTLAILNQHRPMAQFIDQAIIEKYERDTNK